MTSLYQESMPDNPFGLNNKARVALSGAGCFNAATRAVIIANQDLVDGQHPQ